MALLSSEPHCDCRGALGGSGRPTPRGRRCCPPGSPAPRASPAATLWCHNAAPAAPVRAARSLGLSGLSLALGTEASTRRPAETPDPTGQPSGAPVPRPRSRRPGGGPPGGARPAGLFRHEGPARLSSRAALSRPRATVSPVLPTRPPHRATERPRVRRHWSGRQVGVAGALGAAGPPRVSGPVRVCAGKGAWARPAVPRRAQTCPRGGALAGRLLRFSPSRRGAGRKPAGACARGTNQSRP